MLKRTINYQSALIIVQPPSGGCVLKRYRLNRIPIQHPQPPSGGCVLKRAGVVVGSYLNNQPPSGGCVLKQSVGGKNGTAQPSRLQAAVC